MSADRDILVFINIPRFVDFTIFTEDLVINFGCVFNRRVHLRIADKLCDIFVLHKVLPQRHDFDERFRFLLSFLQTHNFYAEFSLSRFSV